MDLVTSKHAGEAESAPENVEDFSDEPLSDNTDPELEAEMHYAKEHGQGDMQALSMKQRLSLARKAKALIEEPNRQINGVIQVPRSQKNLRKSRTAKKRGGAAKKAGSGGKWTWGRATENLDEELETLDSNDPNYDSDSAERSDKNLTFQVIRPRGEDNAGRFERDVEAILLEYFENGDVKSAVESVHDLDLTKDERVCLIRLAITLSADRKPSTRELISRFLAELHAYNLINEQNAALGFVKLLNFDMQDLVIDCPNAADIVGNFIARAIADEVLPHDFLAKPYLCPSKHKSNNDDMDNEKKQLLCRKALTQAEVMLTQKHRLDTVWCSGDGTRPVRYLCTKVAELLNEFVSTDDKMEVVRCLNDLEVPHFHHEVVFQAGIKAIEAMNDRTAQRLALLLKFLNDQDQISREQISTGFKRLYEEMPDLCIDVPPAYTILERWVNICKNNGFLTDDIQRKMPRKGRSRIVSEGDNGRLKVL